MEKQEPDFDLTLVSRPKLSDIRWNRVNDFPLKKGWDVVIALDYADDFIYGNWNDTTMVTCGIGEFDKKVSLLNVLVVGQNTVRIVAGNVYPPKWSFSYSIYILNENGKPAHPTISVALKGFGNYGEVYNVVYTFPMIA